jgi:hypothetical protein
LAKEKNFRSYSTSLEKESGAKKPLGRSLSGVEDLNYGKRGI